MGPYDYTLLIATVLLGAGLGIHYPGLRDRWLHLVLSFSGAYLLSITAVHLVPDAFSSGDPRVGLSLLIGFFLQVVFEQMSTGVEHGHIHAHGGRKIAVPILFGLSMHALLEGAPLELVTDHIHAGAGHNHLLTAILLHKAPAGFALAIVLLSTGFRQNQVWLLVGLFSLMSPLGSLLGAWLVPQWAVPYLLGAVVGSLLHVSTTILFEADDKHEHRLSWPKFGVIIGGIVVALLTAYV